MRNKTVDVVVRGFRSSLLLSCVVLLIVGGQLVNAAHANADTGGLVTLSGIVTDATGAPVPGTTVGFGGESTVTGADGSYVLNVPPNSSSPMSFSYDAAPAPFSSLSTLVEAPLTVGSQDVVEDFVWPAETAIQVSVTDADSNPVVGVTVNAPSNALVRETLSDGTTVIEVRASAGGGSQNCTTDSNGQCTVEGVVGSSPYITSSYQPPPGGSNYPSYSAGEGEVIAVNPLTGVADVTLQFSNMSIQESDGAVTGAVYVSSPTGTTVSNVSTTPIANNTLPSGATVLTGSLSYTVSGLTPGASIDVTLQLPPGSDPTAVFKYQNGSYVDLSSIATISGDTITLHLTDGGLGDADGVANGTIVDPVIPVLLNRPNAPTITQVSGGNGSASVAFTAPTMDGGSSILDYTATCVSSDGGVTGSATGSASPLMVTGLTNGDTYTCSVMARTVVGSSSPSTASSSFSLLTPQSITFSAPLTGTVGHYATLSATGGGSGSPVVFTTDATSGVGVCNVSGANGTTLKYTSVGNCVIDANQLGNTTYAPATTVIHSIKVGKAQLINFGDLSNKTLAQSPVSVHATASSGLTVTFTTTTPAVCTAGGTNGTSITLVGAGTCIVQANQLGNATYNPAPPVNQSFKVSKASQTINFGDLSNKTLAQSSVSVHATASSGLTVTFTSTTPTVCTASGTSGATITLVAAGTCTVQASQLGNATYNPAPPVYQSFKVLKH